MIAGVLLTLAVEYVVGVILGAINFIRQRPWRISGRAERIARRQRGWWGVIISGVVNALLWPALLVQIVRDA